MAIVGSVTGGKPQSVRTRNIAVLSTFAVITGSWMVFRLMSPSRNRILISNEEREKLRARDQQTEFGGKTVRRPSSKTFESP
ncbi:hypothetical protein MAP00_007317 [Monascus purpureus]|nr:hypothetical protein MAP00_007317 [Monascus purpureus]